MIFKMTNISHTKNTDGVNLRCPVCRQLGTFQAIIDTVIQVQQTPPYPQVYLGHRKCPNLECNTHVFIAWTPKGKVLVSYPPERIDFDSSLITQAIVNSFEEAITCHSHNLYAAAAIMIRRTLEDLCTDQNAQGKNLKQRIAALGTKVILPPGLLTGLDNLRLLGNDAVHVEAQVYAQIGKEEVELAIDVTKEVLKSVYQLGDLVTRLEALKKS